MNCLSGRLTCVHVLDKAILDVTENTTDREIEHILVRYEDSANTVGLSLNEDAARQTLLLYRSVCRIP